MNIKQYIDKIINESLNEIDSAEKQKYFDLINQKYNNLLVKVSQNPNFVFLLDIEMENKDWFGDYNKCETNTFNFIKQKLIDGYNNYYPVGGFAFTINSLHPIEHYWTYNKRENKHIEVTPLKDEITCYAGIINFDINNLILKSRSVYDVQFFKGGEVASRYF